MFLSSLPFSFITEERIWIYIYAVACKWKKDEHSDRLTSIDTRWSSSESGVVCRSFLDSQLFQHDSVLHLDQLLKMYGAQFCLSLAQSLLLWVLLRERAPTKKVGSPRGGLGQKLIAGSQDGFKRWWRGQGTSGTASVRRRQGAYPVRPFITEQKSTLTPKDSGLASQPGAER